MLINCKVKISDLFKEFCNKLRFRLKCLNLQKRIILMVGFLLILVFLICFTIFKISLVYTVERNAQTSLKNIYTQKSNELTTYFKKLDDISYTMMFSNWAQSLFRDRSIMMPAEAQTYENNAGHFLSSISQINDGINFAMFFENGKFIQNSSTFRTVPYFNIENQPFYDSLEKNGKYTEFGTESCVYSNLPSWTMVTFYPMKDYYSFNLVGSFLINIPAEKFGFLTNNIVSGYTILLADKNGNEIVSNVENSKEMLSLCSKQDKSKSFYKINNQRIYHDSIGEYDWDIWIVQESLKQNQEDIQKMNLILLFIIPISLFFLFVAIWFSSYLTKPIIMCKDAILKIKDNDLGIKIENHYHDETC